MKFLFEEMFCDVIDTSECLIGQNFATGSFLQVRVTMPGCFVRRSDWFGSGSPMINKFEEFDNNAKKQKP